MNYLKLATVGIILFFAKSSSALEIVFEETHGLPLVHLNIAIKTGAVSDPNGKSGLSLFTGQTLLRGTKKKNKEQIDLIFDQIGASVGFETHAEMMILRSSVLSDQFDTFLDLLYEILTSPSFNKKEIEKLKKETLSDILAIQANDGRLGSIFFDRILFGNHPYSKSVLGLTKDVKSFKKADIKEHYQKIFVAGGMLIVGSGDSTKLKIEKFGKKLEKALPGQAIFPSIPMPKKLTKRRVVIVDKPDRTQVQIFIGQIGSKLTYPDYFPLYLGNHAFGGGGFTTRMFEQIRKQRSWSYSAYSRFKFGTQPRYWRAHYFPKNADIEKSLKYTLNMIKELKEKGLNGPEFQFNKNAIINGAGFMFNTAKKRNENIILEKTLGLPAGFMKSYRKRIKRVSMKATNRALKNFLTPNRQLILVLGTAKKIKKMVAKGAGVKESEIEVIPYKL